MRKIFQLPRNERFLRVLNLREKEAEKIREKALRKELSKQIKMKQKMLSKSDRSKDGQSSLEKVKGPSSLGK